jgi:hypothetical protein
VSSSFTTSLIERRCQAVIDSAIVTGFHAVASRSPCADRGNDRPRAHYARVLAHRR